MSVTDTERLEARRSAERGFLPSGSRGPSAGRGGILSRIIDALIAIAGIALVLAIATVPLRPGQQAIFAVMTAIVFLIVNRFPGRGVTMFLVMLSLAVSLRYIFWRVTETLDFPSVLELILGTGLALAEVYAIIVLVLGYVQTVWPLHRRPMPLPEDPETWPTVDVYIPTYNEPMRVVRATVLAAMVMDWPRDKMRVWLLDDGRREEFRLFAEAAGCGYITRTDNRHAKAGNLNNAMAQTDGEFICVFDCDHIPTRAFLQMTMGWMVEEANLALIQTPHHFYSPDPFQRNLAAGTRVPAEGNMFYGLVQDGNDYWNATFFCGSCAVLRRTALETVGGFAVETVTEDAHTMLKMHRKGWDSAYLRLPLAAGLATERLAMHIGQRVRWARGMLQIFRLDNPLLGRGLTIGQRICYLQAMGHFLFALPRFVFLTSPLAYLLADQNVIAASPLAITAFALPHIFHSVATNSRVQREWRHSFWSEIYETVLACFLVRVTISTLISPKRGKFNVTAKGGLLENGFFDLSAVYPNLILALLLIVGVLRGIIGLFLVDYGATAESAAAGTLIWQALLLNTIWAFFSLLVVMAALAVGRETRQIRSRARINANLPISIYLPDGRIIAGRSRDLSQGGGSLIAERPPHFVDGTDVEVEFPVGDQLVMVPARILRWDDQVLQARWQPTTIEEEARLVQAVFGRADAWTDWANYPKDRPIASLYRVLVSIGGLFRPPDRSPSPRKTGRPPRGGGEIEADVTDPIEDGRRRRGRQLAGTVGLVIGALLLTFGTAAAQTTVRPIPQMVAPLQPTLPPPVSATPVGAITPSPSAAPPAVAPRPSAPPAGPGVIAAPPPPLAPDTGGLPTKQRVVTYRFSELRQPGSIALSGVSPVQGLEFGIRQDEVVVAAQAHLIGATGPHMIPEYSEVKVTLNDEPFTTIPANVPEPANHFDLTAPISPLFFKDTNELFFHFTGRYTRECNDPLSPLLWATIDEISTLTLTLDRVPPVRDISRLPLPFFDSREKLPLNLPVILSTTPSNDSLRVAGIVSSWFGALTTYRGTNFPVLSEPPADGNAIMVVVGTEGSTRSFLPPINGPTLGVIPNPNDPWGSILLIAGRTGDEAATAATALVTGSRGLAGSVVAVQAVDVPARAPYDAPNWIPTNRPVKFGELVDDVSTLTNHGYSGTVRVPFATAPDYYTWRTRGFPEDIHYRIPPVPVIEASTERDRVGPAPSGAPIVPPPGTPDNLKSNGLTYSRIAALVNDQYLADFPLLGNGTDSWFTRLLDFGVPRLEAKVAVPPYYVFGQNQLQFFFDLHPVHRGECIAIPDDLRESVDPDSTIDLSRGYRFAVMPNLAYYVNSGFPFTRMADFSQTVVVVSANPTSVEINAYLNEMGRIGAITGYPTIRMAVARPDGVNAFPDRDVLMIGTIPRMQAAADMLRDAPVHMDGNRLTTDVNTPLLSIRKLFGDPADIYRDNNALAPKVITDRQLLDTRISAGIDDQSALIEGAESPLSSGRSVVAVLATTPQGLANAIATFRDNAKAPDIQGDLAIVSGGVVSSYRAAPTYTVGALPFWIWPSYALRDKPYISIIILIVGCVLLGFAFYWAMRRRANRRARQGPVA